MGKAHKKAAFIQDNALSRAMLHAPGVIGNMHGAGRPVVAPPSEVTKAVNTWFGAYLAGYSLGELEKALDVVQRHPDQAWPGFSRAKTARQRLQTEINRQRAASA